MFYKPNMPLKGKNKIFQIQPKLKVVIEVLV